jgi:hypothetical protein
MRCEGIGEEAGTDIAGFASQFKRIGDPDAYSDSHGNQHCDSYRNEYCHRDYHADRNLDAGHRMHFRPHGDRCLHADFRRERSSRYGGASLSAGPKHRRH